ncbi:hypothetical protein BAUCODRAFT_76271 [Baudoinia panamericana UAMH 10762]|uniref:SAC3/GANP/THP3 conserved domain-containing protein n=1 Tax=Baudoinia panamericana (strain UAMH 10762) TaxID=717646 RepID=M2MQ09_BAUPA|nr:uncharacterized protein BAUCODRAFT_76271 [Baudoinia panamericana UAMH 10762]EMC93533.1 hypothetical protein BAUCODRAFT_76271 [Baudoinia panamericana UAMH 10762]
MQPPTLAYTAVNARQTLQRPVPAVQPIQQPQKVSWNTDVRHYVSRAFDPDSEMPGITSAMMQEKLKFVITHAAESHQLGDIDWGTYPLPQQLIKEELERAALQSNPAETEANSNTSTVSAIHGFSSPLKRKNGDVDMTGVEELEVTPPWKKNNTSKLSMEDRITGKGKGKNDKKQKTVKVSRSNALSTDPDVLEKRKQRFGHVTPEPSPYLSSHNESPKPTDGPLVGTCQTIEKSYFRLTAPPPPDVVRPLPVLEKALNHVRSKWKREHNYRYACDQLKSLRQDLTVQHVRNDFTVKVYEVHARIALEMKDLGEYNQCQTQLRALYKLGLGGNPEEFTAYRILYILYTCNRADMNDVLADLTAADKKKAGVQHALQVRAALASGNYHRFFRLYRDAPFMSPYLLDMIIGRERLASMASICRAYKQDVNLQFIVDELAFNAEDPDTDTEPDPAVGRTQCIAFLSQNGGEPFIERRNDGEIRFHTAKAIATFEGAKGAAFRSVDIKGQI